MDHAAIAVELGSLHAPCCDPMSGSPMASISPDLDGLLDELVKYIYETKGMGFRVDVNMVRHYAEHFWEGIKQGYGKDITEVVTDSVDHRMLSALRKNVWQFSAAKNYSQLRALSNALIGSDGKVLSFSAFKKAAYEINNEHVGPWLKAEYDLSIGGSQMAAKWAAIQENNVPILEFDAVMDRKTTETCRSLNGVRKATNDPFWNIYYPPNHYYERSTVREVYSGAITPSSSIDYPTIPDMFKVNLGKEGLAFPPGHPYFKDLPEQVRTTADKLSKHP